MHLIQVFICVCLVLLEQNLFSGFCIIIFILILIIISYWTKFWFAVIDKLVYLIFT